MFRTVYVDRGDHYHVIGCYEGSPRHRSMNESQWAKEYASSGDYLSMRLAVPGSVAGITPRSIGKWTKDWKSSYDVNPSLILQALSGDADFDGVPVVRGAPHLVMVKVPMSHLSPCKVRVIPSSPLKVSCDEVDVGPDGAQVMVGPVEHACEVTITVADPSGVLRPAFLKIRFR